MGGFVNYFGKGKKWTFLTKIHNSKSSSLKLLRHNSIQHFIFNFTNQLNVKKVMSDDTETKVCISLWLRCHGFKIRKRPLHTWAYGCVHVTLTRPCSGEGLMHWTDCYQSFFTFYLTKLFLQWFTHHWKMLFALSHRL